MLSRKAPMKRTGTLHRAGWYWKPDPPSKEEGQTRRMVRQRSQGQCEGRLSGCLGAATDKAHRVGRGVGGKWTPANILDLCRVCHSWTHANPAAAKNLGLMLESWQDPTVEPVAYCNSGWVLLDDDGHLWPVGDEAA